MSTSAQLLKAYGYLPAVGLDDLAGNRANQVAAAVDSGVLAGRTCGSPDLFDDEIADTMADRDKTQRVAKALSMDEEDAHYLAISHNRMRQQAQTGSGSWPAGCHDHIDPDRHVVTYYVREDSFPDHYKYPLEEPELESLVVNSKVWPWTLEQLKDEWLGRPMLDLAFHIKDETFRRIGAKHVRLDEERGHDVLVRSRRIGGSTIGLGWFPDGSCTDVVEYHIDSSWRPDLDRCSLLLNHENGHCMGFVHQFSGQNRHRGVMSYSWPNHTYGFLKGDEGILPRDPSLRQAEQFFGDEEYPADTEPTLPDPGYNGVVFLKGQSYKIRVDEHGMLSPINGVFTYDNNLLGFQLIEE